MSNTYICGICGKEHNKVRTGSANDTKTGWVIRQLLLANNLYHVCEECDDKILYTDCVSEILEAAYHIIQIHCLGKEAFCDE